MVQKNKKWIFCILPLSLVVVFWLYEINLIAYADSSQFRPPQSQMQSTKRYEEGRALNVGVIEKVEFLRAPAKPTATQQSTTNTANTEKKKETPAWLTILGAVGLLGASQALKKESPAPVAPKQEFKIMKVPRIITANITEMIDKTMEVIKKVPYTAYETMQRTVDKVVDVTKKVAETVYETVNEKIITPVKETYDKAVEKTKQVTEYVTTKVEETYKYATQVTKNVTETVMQSVREAYDVVKQVPRQVTEYITTKINQTKQVARTVYDNVKKTAVWVENKVSTVWDEVKETKTRVVEKFENVAHWVGDKYRTVTEKFWGKTGDRVSYQDVPVYGWVAETSTNWIKKGWNWLKSTTTKWVNKIVSWTKKKIIEPVYGWVTRSYQQLVEAGHWVTDRVKRLVNETYTEIRHIPRTITEKIKHVSEWVEKVPRTVYDTVTEVISKTVPVVKTVYDTVKETAFRMVEKPVQIVKQVAETVWNTGTRLVDKIVPVVKDVAYTAYEKAERLVDKIVEVVKQVPKTIYKEITEKVITPVVETYQVAIEKLKDVKEYITVKTPEIKQITRTVFDEMKFPTLFAINPAIAMITLPQETKEDIAIGSGKWTLGIVEMLTNPQTYVNLSTLGENGIKLLGRILTPKSLEEVFGFNKTELSSAELLIPSHWHGPIDPKWVEASNETQTATMLGLDVATLALGVGELTMALKGAKVVNGVNTAKKSEGVLNLIKNLFSKSKTTAPADDIGKAVTNVGKYKSLLPNDEIGKVFHMSKTADGKIRYFVNGEKRTVDKFDFILKDDKLTFGEKHSFMSQGKSVDFAGTMKLSKDGKSIKYWDNSSGHYQPNPNDINGQEAVRQAFKEKFGLELPEFTPVKLTQ